MQEIEARSNGAWRPSPGSVYPALSQLEDEGLVRAEESGGRKLFDLTDAGRTYVTEHADELGTPWERGRRRASTVGELRTLVFGVGAAVMQVVQAGTETQVAEAAKVLEETRRSLYRILAGDERGPRRTTNAARRGVAHPPAQEGCRTFLARWYLSARSTLAEEVSRMGSRGARMRSTMSDTFWILVLSVIVLFAFFVALGAFAPGEVAWLTLGVLALALLWTVHAVVGRRATASGRDPATIRNRERRGF